MRLSEGIPSARGPGKKDLKSCKTSARDPYLFLPDLIKFGKQVFMLVFFPVIVSVNMNGLDHFAGTVGGLRGGLRRRRRLHRPCPDPDR